jgi:hypothetical protein
MAAGLSKFTEAVVAKVPQKLFTAVLISGSRIML